MVQPQAARGLPTYPRVLTVLLLTMVCNGSSSCAGRANEPEDTALAWILVAPGYALMAPWALAGMTMDHIKQEEFRRAANAHRANPAHIPVAVARTVAGMSDIKAHTVDQLLALTGLADYRQDVLLVYLGAIDQDLWVYYQPNAALNARFDPITRRIVGPITNYSGRRLQKTGADAAP